MGELIALEGADEPHGFTFRLAVVAGKGVHAGGRKRINGVTWRDNDPYVTVHQYARSPFTSASTFKMDEASDSVLYEAVIARKVKVNQRRRSQRAPQLLATTLQHFVVLNRSEVERIEAAVFSEAIDHSESDEETMDINGDIGIEAGNVTVQQPPIRTTRSQARHLATFAKDPSKYRRKRGKEQLAGAQKRARSMTMPRA